jgi:ADP-ribose pyrophosphatase YjhB (NUDIX family)
MTHEHSLDRIVIVYQFPKLGVSAAIWRDGKVLLAQRGKEPLKGVWSLPGGAVEPGEEIRKAALRELREEAGIEAELAGIADVADVIRRDAEGAVTFHYAVVCFAGRWTAGEARAGDDAMAVTWAALADLGGFSLTERTADIIRASQRLLNI